MSRSHASVLALATTLFAPACSSTSSSAAADASTPVATDSGVAADAGPAGTLLKCDSSGKDAFDTYGAAAFVAVNEAIFANVNAEIGAHGTTNLGTAFTKIGTGMPASTADDAPTFRGKLAAFLVYVYGGPTSITYTDNKMYSGIQDIATAHIGLNITSTQYDYFVASVIVPALTSNGVKHGAGGTADPNDVSTCFAPVLVDPNFKILIVGE